MRLKCEMTKTIASKKVIPMLKISASTSRASEQTGEKMGSHWALKMNRLKKASILELNDLLLKERGSEMSLFSYF